MDKYCRFGINLELCVNYLIFLRLRKIKLETFREVCNLGASKACCEYDSKNVLLWGSNTSQFFGEGDKQKRIV